MIHLPCSVLCCIISNRPFSVRIQLWLWMLHGLVSGEKHERCNPWRNACHPIPFEQAQGLQRTNLSNSPCGVPDCLAPRGQRQGDKGQTPGKLARESTSKRYRRTSMWCHPTSSHNCRILVNSAGPFQDLTRPSANMCQPPPGGQQMTDNCRTLGA